MKALFSIFFLFFFFSANAQHSQRDFEYESATKAFKKRRLIGNEDSLYRSRVFMVDKSRFPKKYVDDTTRSWANEEQSAWVEKEMNVFPDMSDKRINTIFKKCILDVAWGVKNDNNYSVCCVVYFIGLDPSPKVKRFQCWVRYSYLGNPIKYGIELTNEAADSAMPLSEFILNARITLVLQLGLVI